MLTTSIVNVCVVFNPSVFCICDEQEWCTAYGTPNWVFVYFNSVTKRVTQCCCTLILLPKSTLNANLTTTNRFFTNDDWQRGRFENFESDHQYESNLESDVRFEIESNHEASQIPTNHPPSVLWHCWLGHQTCKNRRPYNLYCVGADVKPCSINQSINDMNWGFNPQPPRQFQPCTCPIIIMKVVHKVHKAPIKSFGWHSEQRQVMGSWSLRCLPLSEPMGGIPIWVYRSRVLSDTYNVFVCRKINL